MRWNALAAGVLLAAACALALAPAAETARTQAPPGLEHAKLVAFSSSVALELAPDAPDALVMAPRPLLAPEAAVLRAYVEDGGTLVIVGADLAAAGPLADGVAALPGAIYAARAEDLPQRGLLALDLRDPAWTPLLSVGQGAFRDTNGNALVEEGEPAGPFVVAARRDVGDGRVVVAALGPGLAAAEPSFLPGLAGDALAGDAWIDAPAGASWIATAGRGADRALSLPALHPAAALVAALALAGGLMLTARREGGPQDADALADPRAWLETLRPEAAKAAMDDEPGSDGL